MPDPGHETSDHGFPPVEADVAPLPPPPVPWTYRASLLAVTLGVVLLPLVYVALVLAVAGATAWHLVAHTGLLEATESVRGRLAAYFGPGAVGGLLTLFLVKPLFIRPRVREAVFPVDPGTHPELFRLIHTVCRRIDAPAPSRVDLDCDVNASASFRGGLAGMRRGELVLTIGLPMAAGMSTGQLAGVLAHEFGHFAQGGGMRLTFLLRHVNHWFARVVHQRDWLDHQLEEWAAARESGAALVLRVAQGGIWLGRRLLDALRRIGQTASCLMLRRMEDDADRWEVRVAGSATFRATVLRLQELGAAAAALEPVLADSWRRGELPADIPGAVARLASDLGPDWHRQRAERLATRRTGWLDTHPSDADRLRAAEALAEPGILGDDTPAASVFRDFPALCRELTRFHYAQVLGLDLSKTRLTDEKPHPA